MRATLILTLAMAISATAERIGEACSEARAQVGARVVVPGDAAVAVPTNARVMIEYVYTEDPNGELSFEPTIELRRMDGTPVAAAVEEHRSVRWRTFVLTPDEALQPGVSYQVWDDTVALCTPAEDPSACRGPMATVATFTAGDSADLTAPTIGSLTSESFYSDPGDDTTCDFDGPQVIDILSIEGVADDGPTDWVRFQYYGADGMLAAGPFPVDRVGRECGNPFHIYFDVGIASDRYSIRAVDVAGNVEAIAHEVDGMSCDEGRGSDDGGCSTGRGLGPLSFVLAFGLLARRSRRAQSGVVRPTSRHLPASSTEIVPHT